MQGLSLFRKKTVWLPTPLGAAIILMVIAAALCSTVLYLHSFLAIESPAGTPLLVVEGWIPPEELDQALARIRVSTYTRILTTGGPLPRSLVDYKATTYAELARSYLLRNGLPPEMVTALPSPYTLTDRTYINALMVRAHLEKSKTQTEAIDVYSTGVHSRRSRLVYAMALGPKVRVGVIAATPSQYDADQWWRSSIGTKMVVAETISWLWTVLFFSPESISQTEKTIRTTPPHN